MGFFAGNFKNVLTEAKPPCVDSEMLKTKVRMLAPDLITFISRKIYCPILGEYFSWWTLPIYLFSGSERVKTKLHSPDPDKALRLAECCPSRWDVRTCCSCSGSRAAPLSPPLCWTLASSPAPVVLSTDTWCTSSEPTRSYQGQTKCIATTS